MADLHFTPTSKRDDKLVALVKRDAKKANKSIAAVLREILEARYRKETK